jgi:DnaJ-class molecular chaperone
MMNDSFTVIKCPNCSGYGGIGKEPNRVICPTCKGKGVIVIDNLTGKLVVYGENETQKPRD